MPTPAAGPSASTADDDAAAKKRLAGELFNGVWALLEKPDRSADEDARMVHEAHASCALWMQVGRPENAARGEWQVSRVYATVRRPEPAIYHATRCLEVCRRNGIGDWDIAFAYEALARAHAVAGEIAESRRWLDEARRAAAAVKDGEDRALVEADLATIPTS